jgi:ABC-type branched-subunit amino acid transport system substrate-binding protein
MTIKNTFSTTAIAGVIAMGLVMGTAPAINSAEKILVIAVEAPLSGSQASSGRDMLRGVQLAARQANAKGGVLGMRVKVVRVDDQANPDLAAASVAKAVTAGAFAVVGPYNSSVGVINLPTYLKEKIVPVQMTSTNDTNGLGVTVQPKNNQIAPTEIDYLSRSSGCPKVVMLVDPSAYTQGMANRVGKAMVCGDGVPVTSIAIEEGLDNYTSQVAEALALNPDELYISTYYPEGAKIAQAISAANSQVSCLMGLANVDPGFISSAGLTASQRCVFSGLPEAGQMPGAQARAYTQEYTKEFMKAPGVWGIFTYDSANLLFKQIESAGKADFNSVLKKLKNTKNYRGATGIVTINPKTGNRKNVPVFILQVNDKGVYTIVS